MKHLLVYNQIADTDWSSIVVKKNNRLWDDWSYLFWSFHKVTISCCLLLWKSVCMHSVSLSVRVKIAEPADHLTVWIGLDSVILTYWQFCWWGLIWGRGDCMWRDSPVGDTWWNNINGSTGGSFKNGAAGRHVGRISNVSQWQARERTRDQNALRSLQTIIGSPPQNG